MAPNAPRPVSQWPSVYDRANSLFYTASDWDGSAVFEIPNVVCNRVRFVDQAWLQLKTAAVWPATLRLLRVKADQSVSDAMTAGQYLNAAIDLSSTALEGVQTSITLVAGEHKLNPGDTLYIVNPSTTAASGGLDRMAVGVALRDVES